MGSQQKIRELAQRTRRASSAAIHIATFVEQKTGEFARVTKAAAANDNAAIESSGESA